MNLTTVSQVEHHLAREPLPTTLKTCLTLCQLVLRGRERRRRRRKKSYGMLNVGSERIVDEEDHVLEEVCSECCHDFIACHYAVTLCPGAPRRFKRRSNKVERKQVSSRRFTSFLKYCLLADRALRLEKDGCSTGMITTYSTNHKALAFLNTLGLPFSPTKLHLRHWHVIYTPNSSIIKTSSGGNLVEHLL